MVEDKVGVRRARGLKVGRAAAAAHEEGGEGARAHARKHAKRMKNQKMGRSVIRKMLVIREIQRGRAHVCMAIHQHTNTTHNTRHAHAHTSNRCVDESDPQNKQV